MQGKGRQTTVWSGHVMRLQGQMQEDDEGPALFFEPPLEKRLGSSSPRAKRALDRDLR